MTCYYPIKAYRPLSKVDGGRLVFNSAKALNPDNPVKLPCNNCIGCRADRAQEWAARCYHESQMWPSNAFITLTYSDEHLPSDYSLHKREFQLFMKKLRKHIPTKIRFYGCGEYGPENLRPHYHSLIFNYDFPDKIFWKTTPQGDRLYTSAQLEEIWGKGFCTVGDVTHKSAGYCAEYVMKKISGELAATHYLRTHPVIGSVHLVEPEFALRSMRPGIGATWYDKFRDDCFPSDFIVVDGKQRKVPTYYSKKLQEDEQEQIKRRRKRASLPRKADNTKERLAVREEVKRSRRSRLVRTL